jgi:serine/threonine protein kinase
MHRDIKPENLVFDERGIFKFKGYLKITDFGIACNDDPRNFKYMAGTPAYMGFGIIYST